MFTRSTNHAKLLLTALIVLVTSCSAPEPVQTPIKLEEWLRIDRWNASLSVGLDLSDTSESTLSGDVNVKQTNSQRRSASLAAILQATAPPGTRERTWSVEAADAVGSVSDEATVEWKTGNDVWYRRESSRGNSSTVTAALRLSVDASLGTFSIEFSPGDLAVEQQENYQFPEDSRTRLGILCREKVAPPAMLGCQGLAMTEPAVASKTVRLPSALVSHQLLPTKEMKLRGTTNLPGQVVVGWEINPISPAGSPAK